MRENVFLLYKVPSFNDDYETQSLNISYRYSQKMAIVYLRMRRAPPVRQNMFFSPSPLVKGTLVVGHGVSYKSSKKGFTWALINVATFANTSVRPSIPLSTQMKYAFQTSYKRPGVAGGAQRSDSDLKNEL